MLCVAPSSRFCSMLAYSLLLTDSLRFWPNLAGSVMFWDLYGLGEKKLSLLLKSNCWRLLLGTTNDFLRPTTFYLANMSSYSSFREIARGNVCIYSLIMLRAGRVSLLALDTCVFPPKLFSRFLSWFWAILRALSSLSSLTTMFSYICSSRFKSFTCLVLTQTSFMRSTSLFFYSLSNIVSAFCSPM